MKTAAALGVISLSCILKWCVSRRNRIEVATDKLEIHNSNKSFHAHRSVSLQKLPLRESHRCEDVCAGQIEIFNIAKVHVSQLWDELGIPEVRLWDEKNRAHCQLALMWHTSCRKNTCLANCERQGLTEKWWRKVCADRWQHDHNIFVSDTKTSFKKKHSREFFSDVLDLWLRKVIQTMLPCEVCSAQSKNGDNLPDACQKENNVHQDVAAEFADLHDRAGRMVTKGVVPDSVEWPKAREYFYWRLRRRLAEDKVFDDVAESSGEDGSEAAVQNLKERLGALRDSQGIADDDKSVANWLEGEGAPDVAEAAQEVIKDLEENGTMLAGSAVVSHVNNSSEEATNARDSNMEQSFSIELPMPVDEDCRRECSQLAHEVDDLLSTPETTNPNGHKLYDSFKLTWLKGWNFLNKMHCHVALSNLKWCERDACYWKCQSKKFSPNETKKISCKQVWKSDYVNGLSTVRDKTFRDLGKRNIPMDHASHWWDDVVRTLETCDPCVDDIHAALIPQACWHEHNIYTQVWFDLLPEDKRVKNVDQDGVLHKVLYSNIFYSLLVFVVICAACYCIFRKCERPRFYKSG